MSRILHCVSTLSVGGVEHRVLRYLQRATEGASHHDHALCAFRGGPLADQYLPALRDRGVACHVLDRTSRFDPAFRRALKRVTRDWHPNIVHAYNPGAALWTRLILHKRNDAIVVHCGGIGVLKNLTGRLMERFLLPRTAGFIFNSHSTAAVWQSSLPINCPHEAIHNGIELPTESDSLPPLPPKPPLRLLTVGRLVPIKSISTQLEALRILHDRGHQDIELTIVGDGPARPDLEKRTESLGLSTAVHFEGFQPDPRSYHNRSHLYLCTSYNETFSITLAEAMADGMIAIAASVGGPSELIEDDVSGFLVPGTEPPPPELKAGLPRTVYDHRESRLRPPRGLSPVALADRIADTKSRLEQLAGMRSAARDRIAQHFSHDRYIARLDAFYDRIAGR